MVQNKSLFTFNSNIMKKIISQLTVFSFITITGFFLILSLADGYSDAFYFKFATPKQESLILGTSKAAQGLKPDVFNEICNVNMFNFAFTAEHSPYGETYFRSIQNKIKKGKKAGVFILTIDPLSISSRTSNPNDSVNFRELNLCLGNTENVDADPNFEYLLNNLGGDYWRILAGKYFEGSTLLHKNGWLEVSIPIDSAVVNYRIEKKIKEYKRNLQLYRFSTLRFHYLKETINLLNNYGDVYLVRLPTYIDILEIENKLVPDFNKKIKDIIPLTKGYFDMTVLKNEFNYTDGIHLYKTSSEIVSKKIAKWISMN